MKKVVFILVAIAAIFGLSGCVTQADTVNENINKSAESFEVNRKILFYNGISDKIVGVAEGKCSVERDGQKIQAICKVGENEFTRDEMGLSDNMTYFAIQTAPVPANSFRKRVVINPLGVIPDFDVQVGK